MTSQTSADVLGILSGDSPEPRAVLDARSAVQRDPDARRRTVAHLTSLPADGKGAAAVRRGIALFVLGRDAEAASSLAGSGARIAKILRARALAATGRRAEAVKVLGDVKGDADAAFVAGECLADLGDADGLEAAIAAAGADATGSDFAYLRGRLAELQGEREAARKIYDEAGDASPPHVLSLFRAALDEALYGDDDEAIRIYRECVALPMAPRNAWLNLGNLYEDRGEFTKARDCFRAVIDADPADPRARMFERDALASQNMFYDEDFERRSDKRSAILRLPVTDFELSVRSRNCLAKMGVRTLGDLVQKTEAELLSYKNFGETSLQEIKDVLAQKGLRLGMTREEIVHESDEARTILEGIGTDTDRRKMLQKPLSDLELSVRSRHCMNVLGLKTIGDLAQRSEADLMTIKNFGQTSLNEVKQKLAEIGLTLAPSPAVK